MATQRKKILIAAGGTGGHVFPAVALAGQLSRALPAIELLFAGGGLSKNAFFQDSGYVYEDIEAATIVSFRPSKLIYSAYKIARGLGESLKLLKNFSPDVVVGFGSYHTLPLLIACRFTSTPVVLYESNCMPGRVVRFFSKQAKMTGVQFPEAIEFLRGPAIDVGMPLREGYSKAYCSKQQALTHFGLNPDKFTILVFGGSQGAARLNQLFSQAAVIHLAERCKHFQVIHLTGDAASARELQETYQAAGIQSYTAPFEKKMYLAWGAADIAISRAGAASIAEQIEFEVPGILIPYPHAKDRHQDINCDHMVEKVGGAIKCLEQDLSCEVLAKHITALAQDKKKLLQMRAAIHDYKAGIRRRDLSSIVCEVAGIKTR